MKKLLVLSISVLLLLSCLNAHAQSHVVPKNYSLVENQDYEDYESDVLACINWLEKEPFDNESKQKKEVIAFITQWITGSPNITVNLNAEMLGFAKKNPDLIIYFMSGWTKFGLENPNDKDNQIKANLAALRSVLNIYKEGKGVKKDKFLEKLIDFDQANTLEDWIRKELKGVKK